MSKHQPSATVFFTDVLTAQAFRTFFAWLFAFAMLFGAISKIGIAQRHFQAWSDLDIVHLMPLVGTIELVLVLTLLPRLTRPIALAVAVLYHAVWIVLSYTIDDWEHVFRSGALLALGILAIFYRRDWKQFRKSVTTRAYVPSAN